MKKHFTVILFCVITLVSCSKDDHPPIIQDGVYANDGRAIAGPISLYVGNIHITDRNFIHNFLKRRIGSWLADSILSEQAGVSLPFLDVKMAFGGDSIAYDLVPSYPDTFHISRLSDNTRLLVNNRKALVKPQLMGDLGCGNVEKYIRMNSPIYACGDLNYPGGYCMGHQQSQLNIEGDHLVIPMLTYFFMRPIAAGISCVASGRYINDDLNTNIFSKLRKEDTLAVQTYSVKLYKQ